ncbi:MAG TPA: formate dehydrogenase accessory sulfurtransferase FdhD [Acidimicrobiales bacterium]|nr:formate dehydrogenase accessory sulfurtransferase FdhD [Acidimicrobiales bacterium]
MAERIVARRPIVRIAGQGPIPSMDEVAGEEPLEIRVDGAPVSVTMRTPGHDFELALGFCLAEGLLGCPEGVTMRYCGDDRGAGSYNVVEVHRRRPAAVSPARLRRVATTSACGVCGSTSIDALRTEVGDLGADAVVVDADVVVALPDRLGRHQRVFARTGGLHAAALASPDGELACVREDVGRHNAVDKVLGWAATHGQRPATGTVLVVSGRVAFEIVQKAALAGVPVVVAVSAPTSLAVDLAASVGMTLVGFVRGGSMNVYTGAERIRT